MNVQLWKLTDEHDQTRGYTHWGPGITHTAPGKGDLCTSGWIHAYTDPLLAVLLNPMHGYFSAPHLWEAEGVVGKTDHGLKVGCTSLTTLRRIDLPEVTKIQRVRFAILCALVVYREPQFVAWAQRWLSGKDRTVAAAEAAWVAAAEAAAVAAAEAAAAAELPLDLPALARQAIAEETGRP